MLQTWKDILESKKFWYASLSVAAMIAMHWGLNIDVDKALATVSPLMVLIGAQGWADNGKEAEKMRQESLNAPPETVIPPGAQKGAVRLTLMIALMAAGPAYVVACHTGAGPGPVGTFIDCTKQNIGQELKDEGMSLLGKVAIVVESGGDGWQNVLEQLMRDVGTDAVACAVEAVDTVLTPPKGAAATPGKMRTTQEIREKGWRFK